MLGPSWFYLITWRSEADALTHCNSLLDINVVKEAIYTILMNFLASSVIDECIQFIVYR